MPTSVCSIFLCQDNGMVGGVGDLKRNVRACVDAYDWTWTGARRKTVRESALKVTCGVLNILLSTGQKTNTA